MALLLIIIVRNFTFLIFFSFIPSSLFYFLFFIFCFGKKGNILAKQKETCKILTSIEISKSTIDLIREGG